jgi:fatty acid desaturase
MNNLEQIPLKQVISYSGEEYISFRNELSPKYGIVWRDIFLGYLFMFSFFFLFLYLEKTVNSPVLLIMLLPFFGMLTGFWVAYIQLFIHEAAHYNIHPDKKMNDLFANIFLGWLTGINIKPYRKTHWKHHQRLGHTDDSENSYFNGLTFMFLLKTITGLHVLNILMSRNRSDSGQTESTNRKQKVALALGILLHAALLTLLIVNGFIFTALVWISAIGVFYPFFATIRQLMEHRDEKAGKDENFFERDHGKMSRLFKDSLFAYFFGGAGFNRHLIHHWDPLISYTRLADVEKFIGNSEACEKIIRESKTTYLKTFLKLIK